MIVTYQQASDYLGTRRDRPLPGRATRLQRRDDTSIAVKYQATDVVTYQADGLIVLRTGGWQTSTTKARMLEYSRVRIYQSKGVWYVQMSHLGSEVAPSLFYDGMMIDANGQPTAPRYYFRNLKPALLKKMT